MNGALLKSDRLQDEQTPHDYTFMGRKTIMLRFDELFDFPVADYIADAEKVIAALRGESTPAEPRKPFATFTASSTWAEQHGVTPEHIKEHYPAVGDVEIKS